MSNYIADISWEKLFSIVFDNCDMKYKLSVQCLTYHKLKHQAPVVQGLNKHNS